MSKEAEDYYIKDMHTDINGYSPDDINLKERSWCNGNDIIELMQSYADSQIKDILIEFVESYNNNDE